MLQIRMRSGNMWQFKSIDCIGFRKSSRAKDQNAHVKWILQFGFYLSGSFSIVTDCGCYRELFCLIHGYFLSHAQSCDSTSCWSCFSAGGIPFQWTPSSWLCGPVRLKPCFSRVTLLLLSRTYHSLARYFDLQALFTHNEFRFSIVSMVTR